ncbi:hypothetical protein C6P41_002271 [Kluyveromyces marxianus]|nr:hypothetical protein C6P43_004966 [Kluyveromyces marxianus]KAG0684469.1 hypothetical protein C6P41_002271 [Kluyveromyces marxianus]
MSIPTTQKAVLIEGNAPVVKTGVPVPELTEGTVLIKVEAVAGNPTDWKHIAYKIGPEGSILGCDVAGTIVKFGPNTSSDNLKVGDTVYTLLHGASVRHPENGGFAEYARASPDMLYKADLTHTSENEIPEGTVKHFETAASLGVSLTTAGVALSFHLGNKLLWNPPTPQHDHPILIWGGAAAVGQQLIQVAKKLNAYTKIITVASKGKEELLKSYGADDVYDYKDPDVIKKIKFKYTNIRHAIDGISNQDSFVQTYRTLAEEGDVTLLHLTMLSMRDIPEAERRDNVKIEGALLYLAFGTDVPFGAITVPAVPAYKPSTTGFIKFIAPHVQDGSIRHIPIKVFPNGLDDVPALTQGIKEGKNQGVKFVARL